MKSLSSLSFLSTSIGSLPHKDPAVAVEFLAANLNEIFCWPQLPKVSQLEDMTSQYAEKLPGLVYDAADQRYFIDSSTDEFMEALEELMIDYDAIVEEGNLELLDKYAISEERCSAFKIWLTEAEKLQPVALKGQITGPFTYATSITDTENKCAYYDETLKETIEKFLALKALWQINEFKKVCPDSFYIMSMDEPSISQYGSSAFMTVQKTDIITSLNNIASVIHKFGGVSFVHCCGKTDWTIITSSEVGMLNFDAYNFSDSLAIYSSDIQRYLEKGGFIAWGLIPTLDPDQVDEANLECISELFENTKQILTGRGVSEKLLLEQSIITPACGTGSLSVEYAEKALKLTAEVAKFFRSRYKR